jgi:hypothetical protein
MKDEHRNVLEGEKSEPQFVLNSSPGTLTQKLPIKKNYVTRRALNPLKKLTTPKS